MKKYKLLKDIILPLKNIKAGNIGTEGVPKGYIYFGDGSNTLVYSISDIEKCTEWFEELVTEPSIVPERIEVENFYADELVLGKKLANPYYHFNIKNNFIPQDKFPAIKQAIESVLNDTVVDDNAHSVLMNDNIYFHNNGRSYNEWFYEFRIKKEIEQGKWDALSKLIVDFINAPLGEIITIEQYRAKKYTQSEVDAMMEDTWKAARNELTYAGFPLRFKYNTFADYKADTTKQSPTNLQAEQKEQIDIQNNFCKPTVKDNQEWEIIAFGVYNFPDTIIHKNKDGLYRNYTGVGVYTTLEMIANNHTIHSVRRLSDNTIFSIGDEVDVTCSDGKGFRDTINHFTYTSGVGIMDVYFKNQLSTAFGIHWLNIAKKLPTPNTDTISGKPVFTEEQYIAIWDMIFSQTGYPIGHPKRKN